MNEVPLHAPQLPGKKGDRVSVSRSPALQVTPDFETMSQAAAELLVEAARQKPDTLFCLATGASPARAYELLATAGRSQPERFERTRWLKLDEWGGLAMDDPASCESCLRSKLIEPLQVTAGRFFGWHSRPADPTAECQRISDWLAANGPIDVCVLGVGTNGHLGFNEPAEALHPGPHVARLSDTSVTHSMLQMARGRPQYGLTLGMADLLQSRRIVLLVSGRHKAEPLLRFFSREITTEFPVSFLWLHPAVTIFCDHAAAALVPKESLP